MSKYLNILNGDYYVKTPDGNITLDSSSVIISGNLTVQGDLTTITSTDLAVSDNIIVVNSGEQGAGIALDQAGLRIDRGTRPDAFLVYDEGLPDLVNTQSRGQFVFKVDGGKDGGTAKGIRTNAVTTGGTNLVLVGTGTGIVSVNGTINYERNILNYVGTSVTPNFDGSITKDGDDDRLPNTRAVIDIVNYQLAQGGGGGVIDDDGDTFIAAETTPGQDNDQLEFTTGGKLVARLDQNGFVFLNTNVNRISTTNGKLIIDPSPTGSAGSVLINGNLSIANALAVSEGGTGKRTLTLNGILYGDSANPVSVTDAAGTNNASTSFEILTVNSAGVPVWTDTIDEGTY